MQNNFSNFGGWLGRWVETEAVQKGPSNNLYSGDPKTGHVRFSNGHLCQVFKWCPVFEWFTSLDHFIDKHNFLFIYQMV